VTHARGRLHVTFIHKNPNLHGSWLAGADYEIRELQAGREGMEETESLAFDRKEVAVAGNRASVSLMQNERLPRTFSTRRKRKLTHNREGTALFS